MTKHTIFKVFCFLAKNERLRSLLLSVNPGPPRGGQWTYDGGSRVGGGGELSRGPTLIGPQPEKEPEIE